MIEIGYTRAGEEHSAKALVSHARAAEEAGFAFGMISDHFHPWIRVRGQSPFVWCAIGGIAEATDRFRIATGVTVGIHGESAPERFRDAVERRSRPTSNSQSAMPRTKQQRGARRTSGCRSPRTPAT